MKDEHCKNNGINDCNKHLQEIEHPFGFLILGSITSANTNVPSILLAVKYSISKIINSFYKWCQIPWPC